MAARLAITPRASASISRRLSRDSRRQAGGYDRPASAEIAMRRRYIAI